MRQLRPHVKRYDYGRFVGIDLVEHTEEFLYIAEPPTFRARRAEAREVEQPPSIVLGLNDAQSLMNQLWNCGLRPAGDFASTEVIAALQKQLDDMRTIALGVLRQSKAIA